MKFFEDTKAKYVMVDAGIEQELKDLNPDDKQEFRKSLTGKDDLSAEALAEVGWN